MNRPPPKSTPFPYPALFRSTETVAAVVPKCHRLHGRLQLLVVLQGLDKCGNLLLDVVVLLVGDEVGDLKHLLLSLRSEEHTSELQSQSNIVCRLLLEKKKYEPHTSTKLPRASLSSSTRNSMYTVSPGNNSPTWPVVLVWSA